MQHEILTPKQAAKILQVTIDTLYRELRAGRVAGAFRFGGQWRIDMTELRASVSRTEKRRTEPEPS